jgi:hypothetical protein
VLRNGQRAVCPIVAIGTALGCRAASSFRGFGYSADEALPTSLGARSRLAAEGPPRCPCERCVCGKAASYGSTASDACADQRPGKGALVPIAAGLLRWNTTAHSSDRKRQLDVVVTAFVAVREIPKEKRDISALSSYAMSSETSSDHPSAVLKAMTRWGSLILSGEQVADDRLQVGGLRVGFADARLARSRAFQPDLRMSNSTLQSSRCWPSPRSPWQNAYAKRLIGSIRRECVDHVVVFGECHLRHVLLSYTSYYNGTRTLCH